MSTLRDDLLIALHGGCPGRVVWGEMTIDTSLKQALAADVPAGLTFEEYFGLANYLCGGVCPPGIVEFGVTEDGRRHVKAGLLRTRADLRRIREEFPDPNDPALYEPLRQKLREVPKGLASCVITDLGAGAALVSMGTEGFSYALADDPAFVEEVFLRHAEWSAAVHRNLCSMGFDFIWSGGDIAFNTGPFFSPEVFRQVILPALRVSAAAISLPWVYHSDGNLVPILDDLLSLGMNALHPFEPGAMDIRAVKRQYGKRLCVIGNVSVDLLARGTPENVRRETLSLIQDLHPLGGYILSSGNSLTSYVAPANLRAMSHCVTGNLNKD